MHLYARSLVIVLVNVAVLVGLLAIIEMGFRLGSTQTSHENLQWDQFAPYVMFSNPQQPPCCYRWDDTIHHTSFLGRIVTDHNGFPMKEEVDFAVKRPKASNERVVILTGGSAAWGVGATSNATNIAGRMQTLLNERQSKYRYTVLNLANGAWISFQQYIALSIYGPKLQPDWIVSMDGVNDAAVTCAHSQGAGYPLYYAMMEAYIKAYTFGQLKPVFYRGWLENELLKHSAAYRRLTGKSPINVSIMLDSRSNEHLGEEVIRPTTWADIERDLEFYVTTEGEMIDLFPKANLILSTQPIPYNFEEMFGRIYEARGTADESSAVAALKAHLARLDLSAQGQQCGWVDARQWFMPMSALRLEALVQQRQSADRSVQYLNTGVLFPNLTSAREDFFIDPVHMNDAGMDRVARLYTAVILATDLPDQFEKPRWAGPTPPNYTPEKPDQIRITDATYGMSCKDFKVPANSTNRVGLGNATDAVAAVCERKHGSCNYTVDAAKIGDPAGGCGKDFSVSWRCGSEDKLHDAYLKGEANGKSVTISCVPG